MGSVIQLAAALCILVPFVLAQTGRLTTSSPLYLWLNLVGSAVLAVDAAADRQWGFLLLEGVWAAVSLGSIVRPTQPAAS